MSTKKNISGGPLDVPLLGRSVAADEVAEVPDVQGDGTSPIVWPPDKWQDVPGKTAKASASAKADDTTGKAAS